VSGYILGALILVLALAFVGLFIWSLVRISRALLNAAWTGRAGLNPQIQQGRLRLLGVFCFLVAVVLAALMRGYGNVFEETLGAFSGAVTAVLLLVVVGAPAYIGIQCFLRAKRFDALPATTALSEDTRAPVIYLRSFGDDPKVARRVGIAGFKLDTEEEVIAEIVGAVGPFVGIGRPGEALPYSGAARVYVGDGDWHERVRALLSLARLVILRAGDTPGLWWEIEESAKRVKPERLIFLIPLKRRAYDDFRRKAGNYLPCQLPEYGGRRIPVTSVRAVLFFDADWTPHLLPVQETYLAYWARTFLRFPLLTPLFLTNNVFVKKRSEIRRILEKTLQPILQRGVE